MKKYYKTLSYTVRKICAMISELFGGRAWGISGFLLDLFLLLYKSHRRPKVHTRPIRHS
ncbi:mCG147109 [Mus musculus]|nr:mCG147109 [Mus musculus]